MKRKNERQLGRPRANDLTQPTNEFIIQTASRLFLEKGYPNISVDDVAKACNVTKATIYYYYVSKAELFTETMVQMMIHIQEKMSGYLQENLPLKARLIKITNAHLQATVDIDMNGLTKGMENALSAEQQERIQQAEGNLYQALESVFIAAMEQNEIRKINPRFAVHAYLALMKTGNVNREQDKLFPSTDETANQIVELFWHGISPNHKMDEN
ncbi:TetR/AcrR family transcriptional regulator [Virgibacillus doumboii]|uniref:TetR/AcrR family transcriptional regulator n=1 Tax=Virgibacillus doumboii TaxID=2697503 RepID=UPI0013DF36A6|nr:TetR/AcrR family transcriptional regulator [Virgibacillus doumboii]